MSLHDDYARMTPFEIAFPDSERVVALSAEIAEEAAGRGADPSDPQAFITMGAVDKPSAINCAPCETTSLPVEALSP